MDPALWLKPPFDDETQHEVRRLMKEDPKSLSDAFFQTLSFGTGGMRGLMGVGTNRMNVYTVRAATQGLARYLIRSMPGPKKVFIGYDTRHNSRLFAEETARVLAAHEIEALITEEICPTPLVSFGCRHFDCSAAVMITASHNPPAYNGYKVYWKGGAQVVSPHDEGIMQEVRQASDFSKLLIAPLKSPKIHWIGGDLDQAYLSELAQLKGPVSPLRILYTPLHGTGLRLAKKALHLWGFDQVGLVEPQATPDGKFPNAPSPNPEEESAMRLGMDQMIRTGADLLLATDPDADRMGVAIHQDGKAIRFTGNQIGALLLHHLCTTRKIPKHSACIKTIVTSELLKKIAHHFHVECIDVLTGFKYIAEKMNAWEKTGPHFLFGAEESYGYLYGTMVRDKDGINACCLMAEAAAKAKSEGKTLQDRLQELYHQFGIHREALANLKFPDSLEGMQQMEQFMKRLRSNPPSKIAGTSVTSMDDFLKPSPLPKSDVLRFWLSDGTKLVVRPSGTEPKIKIYIEVSPKNLSLAESDALLQTYLAACKKIT